MDFHLREAFVCPLIIRLRWWWVAEARDAIRAVQAQLEEHRQPGVGADVSLLLPQQGRLPRALPQALERREHVRRDEEEVRCRAPEQAARGAGERGPLEVPLLQPLHARPLDLRVQHRAEVLVAAEHDEGSVHVNTDLTPAEQTHVRTALRFLRSRCGGWAQVGKALHFKATTLGQIARSHKVASASLAVRIARFASVGVDDVLTGRFPSPATCPHCGHHDENFAKLSISELPCST
jgi:hypothetical protein